MLCDEIKEIIPAYIKHTAAEDKIREVEEHLCVCNECREFLGQLMDKPAAIPVQQKVPAEQPIELTPVPTLKEIPPGNAPFPWEYWVLGLSVIILIFFVFLLMKG
ncbi:MAG: zf-HC2 domain-containing protein [Candidatus Omnitrophota bacterium]